MKIFVAHASDWSFREELYEPLRKSILSSEHEIKLPQEHGKETITKEYIKSCDLIIAECSLPSTGQGIELGWASIYEVPIVCVYKKGVNISGALKYVTNYFLEYENTDEMIKKISEFINSL